MTRTRSDWIELTRSMPVEGPGIRGADFFDTSLEDWKKIKWVCDLRDNDTVLDLGCGHGRMALGLLNTKVNYFGYDILPEVVQWSSNVFKPWSNIQFACLPVSNGMYRPSLHQDMRAENLRLPLEDKSVDLVLAFSLFTHIERKSAAERYLQEISRVLKLHGSFISTWFTAPPNEPSNSPERTVLDSVDITCMLHAFNFHMVNDIGGETTGWHDQRRITTFKVRPAYETSARS